MTALDGEDAALLALLRALAERDYAFVTPTPESHARVLTRSRPNGPATLRDVFGWSRDFGDDDLEPEVRALLEQGGGLRREDERLRSAYRVSSFRGTLVLHSAHPTDRPDSVFFGPDSYRFADFSCAELARGGPVGRLVDIGTGSGAGAIAAALTVRPAEVLATDINPAALRLARINAAFAGVEVAAVLTVSLDDTPDGIDVALANPPYIVDAGGRAYRDGGGLHGGRLSLQMAEAALDRLNPGGRLLLYTGAAIVDGRNPLTEALAQLCAERDCTLTTRELDPDVFGEELSRPEYDGVDRIALIGAMARRRA